MRGIWASFAIIFATSAAYADSPFPNLAVPALVKSVTATSTYKDPHDAYAAWKTLSPELHTNLNAQTPEDSVVLWTAWCEGKPDEGIGETVTINFAEPTALDGVSIAAGVWRTDALFAANNQPTSLEVGFDGKPVTVSPSGKTRIEAKAPSKNMKVSTLTVKILAVKKGKMNDSCIANIWLERGDAILQPAIGVDAAAWKALPVALNAMQTAVSDPKRTGLAPLIEFPFTSSNPVGDYGGYGGTKPTTVNSFAALSAACKRFDAASAKENATYVDPLGCPNPANFDSGDDRPDGIETLEPGVLGIDFPSHNDSGVQWQVHWTGKEWRLRATVEDSPVGMM